jgi:hypothetical protein
MICCTNGTPAAQVCHKHVDRFHCIVFQSHILRVFNKCGTGATRNTVHSSFASFTFYGARACTYVCNRSQRSPCTLSHVMTFNASLQSPLEGQEVSEAMQVVHRQMHIRSTYSRVHFGLGLLQRQLSSRKISLSCMSVQSSNTKFDYFCSLM